MSFDEGVLDDEQQLRRRDSRQLLWHLATAGAQVRRAGELREAYGVDRLRGDLPRALLVVTDAPAPATLRVLTRLSCETTPALPWHGVELPRWAGPSDALLIGALDGRHPRLAALAEQGARRGLAMAVAAPAGSPVAAAAGRAPLHELAPDLNPRASRWAILTPLLLALDALGVHDASPARLTDLADALDAAAELCRPGGSAFTNPAKALAIEFAESRPLIAGAGTLASVAARITADALQLSAGVGAVPLSLPDGFARAAALMRGAGPAEPPDFFRDRVDDELPPRARLLVIGDNGQAEQAESGMAAHIQLDEVAASRAASALRRLADELGLRASSLDVPGESTLARFAAAAAIGEFTAAYLALGLGLDPGDGQ